MHEPLTAYQPRVLQRTRGVSQAARHGAYRGGGSSLTGFVSPAPFPARAGGERDWVKARVDTRTPYRRAWLNRRRNSQSWVLSPEAGKPTPALKVPP